MLLEPGGVLVYFPEIGGEVYPEEQLERVSKPG